MVIRLQQSFFHGICDKCLYGQVAFIVLSMVDFSNFGLGPIVQFQFSFIFIGRS